ncbi:CRISPR-associated endoribonuclease Cas2 [Moorella humiferrea]|uniref:CRISPR-associated endonuclease Cas2 n=1 Tax=Neomoorella humiferrea TaxID=676965 RepID=UPI0030D12C28
MHVILVYDINTEDVEGRKRLVKTLKTCRKYLIHIQKSVFEGDLTEGKIALLKKELNRVLDIDRDFVVIYTLAEGVKINRDIITNTPDPTDNFL